MAVTIVSNATLDAGQPAKKKVNFANLGVGAAMNMFEVTTLGQPFEVIKTHLAANRQDNMVTAFKKIYQRGGISGFYQGLIPWAWIEASTKGAVLIFAASEIEYVALNTGGVSPFTAGLLGGMGGGLAQAYTTMGFCTFMKTVEITRHKAVSVPGAPAQMSTFAVASDIFKREGIRGINKGVNAVAVRQCTNWGSRLGLSRLAEETIRKVRKTEAGTPLNAWEKIAASAIGGGLSIWNQPIEVIRVEMQSQLKTVGRPEKMTIANCARWIWQTNGLKGFYRGSVPRFGLGMWQTICMVAGGDALKKVVNERYGKH
ncbi:mitochondrial carrier domain-containing protein [Gamsiella multidivaricata]|uniref:mitochondrial carrier domain-containing protein n=1 Tax=Gamsiella multidivaricata TaxID=101098 RepID=UPI00221F8FCA|nr:mitochondrial carrier domain-containing protein [Gamsiella multidivaricata]KAI7823861.1 mitochondrial carrier domain-containing protein [Gamsiella multidivaricata]